MIVGHERVEHHPNCSRSESRLVVVAVDLWVEEWSDVFASFISTKSSTSEKYVLTPSPGTLSLV
jgi:hypothetical protein